MDTVETASVGVWIEVGARHERPEVNGVSHFIEHMAFKGTRKRDARAIAEEIEAVGGHINAYTSREHTAYYAKVLKEDAGLAIDVISDILQNALIDPEELDRERTVILQEINQSNDTPDDIIYDRFQETAYPEQALGRPVLGLADVVRDMPRDVLADYMRTHYCGPRMILGAAGRIDHDEIVAMAHEKCADLPPDAPLFDDPGCYRGGDFRESRDLEQVHIVLGLESVPFSHPDFYATSVFSTLFGGGMSSRLFQEIREKRGLVYAIHSFTACYSDSGLFGIYAGTGEKEADELIPLMCDELLKVADDLTEEEVSRSRAQLKASVLMGLESTSSRCEQKARQLMVFGRTLSTEEVVAHIEAVDVDTVRRVAKNLAQSRPTFAALGPIGGIEDFDAVAARLKA